MCLLNNLFVGLSATEICVVNKKGVDVKYVILSFIIDNDDYCYRFSLSLKIKQNLFVYDQKFPCSFHIVTSFEVYKSKLKVR